MYVAAVRGDCLTLRGRVRLAALGHAEPVARVVAQRGLDAVEALGRLREKVDAALVELLVAERSLEATAEVCG